MELIGIIFTLLISLWLLISGFGGFLFIYGMSGNIIKSGALLSFCIGCIGAYGLYYVLFEKLTIGIR